MQTSRTAAPRSLRLTAMGMGLALFLTSVPAFADKVAVLPFSGTRIGQAGGATKADLEAARTATQGAVAKVGHTQPTQSEMLTAEMAVKDGVPDTSDEFRAAGRASSSQWTVSARVEPHPGPSPRYRLEIEACQVKSGRVESLAREIDSAQAVPQIGEMLTLLLRPEGIANAPIPWERAAPQLPPAAAPPAQAPAPPPAKAEEAPMVQVTAPPPPAARKSSSSYANGRPLSLGAGLGVIGAFVRPEGARGTATSLMLGGALGYALDAVPGLELRAGIAGSLAGPGAILIEGGARYAWVVLAKPRLYVGPEAGLGAFITTAGDKTGRFWARGSAVGGIGVAENIDIELSADLAVAPGGAGTLAFAGAGARGVIRF